MSRDILIVDRRGCDSSRPQPKGLFVKRECLNHPKLKLLARDLGMPVCFVRGIVESIWIVTAINFPRGDIGRMTDEEIGVATDYPGDATLLIESMVNRRLLDRHDEHRLIVHDWHEHADDAVHYKLARAGLTFANGDSSKRKSPEKPKKKESDSVGDSRRQSPTVGDGLPSPSPSPSPSSPSCAEQVGGECGVHPEESKETYQRNLEPTGDAAPTADLNRPSGKKQPKTAKPPEKPNRQRNELLDALVAADGSDPVKATPPLFSAAAKALQHIRSVSPDATPAEIIRRAENYRRHMPGMKISPHALAKHWARCEHPPTATGEANRNPARLPAPPGKYAKLPIRKVDSLDF
jgi:hypothetical protein